MPRTTAQRSHSFGGCLPCRKRHLKCDQSLPTCNRCRTSCIQCEFSSSFRWLQVSGNSEQDDNTYPAAACDADSHLRRPLYSDQARELMSSLLVSEVPTTVNAVLNEIEEESRNLDVPSAVFALGPFSVFSSDPTLSPSEIPQSTQDSIEDNQIQTQAEMPVLDSASTLDALAGDSTAGFDRENTNLVNSIDNLRPIGDFRPNLEYIDDKFDSSIDLLQWSDLFRGDLNTSFQVSVPWTLDSGEVAISDTPTDFNLNFGNTGTTSSILLENSIAASHSTTEDPFWPKIDLTGDAPALLKHFNDEVIDQMGSLPINEKSPWRTLGFTSAVLTLSDLTILESDRGRIKHANLANFFALLAVSALHLSLNFRIFAKMGRTRDHWSTLSNLTYLAAKSHLRMSISTECMLPKKAKYKVQLMAISAVLATAVLSGDEVDSRYYLEMMEYIIRSRGLIKPAVSRRARQLHNIYAWMRIVSESTHVLGEERKSSHRNTNRLASDNSYPISDTETNSVRNMPSIPGPARMNSDITLDNFLDLEAKQMQHDTTRRSGDSDGPDGQDIHYAYSLRDHENMYMQIYGVPETWLSLVSQTTRLANCMDSLRPMEEAHDAKILALLQPKSIYLENTILLLRTRECPDSGANTSHSIETQGCKPHVYMVHALTSALVIFFYRRIKDLNPFLLQACVDHVIYSLENFDHSLARHGLRGPGTAWPAFVAGAEAMAFDQRQKITLWLDRAFSRSGWMGYKSSKEILIEVWRLRDSADGLQKWVTWVDVSRKTKRWPILC